MGDTYVPGSSSPFSRCSLSVNLSIFWKMQQGPERFVRWGFLRLPWANNTGHPSQADFHEDKPHTCPNTTLFLHNIGSCSLLTTVQWTATHSCWGKECCLPWRLQGLCAIPTLSPTNLFIHPEGSPINLFIHPEAWAHLTSTIPQTWLLCLPLTYHITHLTCSNPSHPAWLSWMPPAPQSCQSPWKCISLCHTCTIDPWHLQTLTFSTLNIFEPP